MKLLWTLGLLLVLSTSACLAQQTPRERVESYFRALSDKRLDLALKTFGANASFTESQKAVLKEYKIVDPTPVGQCEEHLRNLGAALASHNTLNSGYPTTLSALVPNGLKAIPTCPASPKLGYTYERRDEYYYLLSCPNGHGRTPGFPKFSPIDGLIPNPHLSLVNFYKVMNVREENGLTKIKVLGSSPRGIFEQDFVFTPVGGFVSGDFSKEVERLMRAMTKTSVPRASKLDPASLLLGVAVFNDQELIRAAHCRLLQEQLYYKILGVQTRLGEKTFSEVFKHIDQVPKCPTSKKVLQVKTLENGKTLIYCSGGAHSDAGLGPDEPSREM